ncbi:MAG: DUF7467 domain-containing protein [Planctomycetota bacterium]|jgi:hypothetical protein
MTGGDYQGDTTTCTSVDCPQPPGACCFPDGSCEELLEAECDSAGGDWQGAFTTCSEVDCPQPGACCLPDGTCVPVAEAGGGDCTAQGGEYLGDGTECTPDACLGGSCCEFGKPVQLVMRYTGDDCSATWHDQDPDKVECDDFGPLPDSVYILANDSDSPDDGDVWFAGTVLLDELFVIDAFNAGEDKLSSNTWVYIYDVQGGTLLQKVRFHTSCSQPLETGYQFGALLLVDCVGEDEPIPGQCCPSGSDLQALLLEYTGDDCSATMHNQNSGSVECEDFGPLPDTVRIIANKKSDPFDDPIWFDGIVSLSEEFEANALNAGQSKLGGTTYIHVLDPDSNAVLQTVEFHTSCSQPVAVGDQYGASLLLDCTLESLPVADGGPSDPRITGPSFGEGSPPTGDATGDGVTDVTDLTAVILAWGACDPAGDPCPSDLDGDGAVGIEDLLAVLLDWGTDR